MKLKKQKVEFTGWEILGEDFPKLIDLINKCSVGLANNYFEGVCVRFAVIWGDDELLDAEDPMTIFLYAEEDCDDVIKLSLSDVIIHDIEDCEKDGSFAEGLKKISARMKELSERIDAACEKHGII